MIKIKINLLTLSKNKKCKKPRHSDLIEKDEIYTHERKENRKSCFRRIIKLITIDNILLYSL